MYGPKERQKTAKLSRDDPPSTPAPAIVGRFASTLLVKAPRIRSKSSTELNVNTAVHSRRRRRRRQQQQWQRRRRRRRRRSTGVRQSRAHFVRLCVRAHTQTCVCVRVRVRTWVLASACVCVVRAAFFCARRDGDGVEGGAHGGCVCVCVCVRACARARLRSPRWRWCRRRP